MVSSMLVKVTCLAVICLILDIPLVNAGPTCAEVLQDVTPCLGYVTNPGPSPPEPCCDGVKTLNGEAQTPEDRRDICECFKSIMGGIPGLNFGAVAALPENCGVELGYEIGPTMDCSMVTFY